MSTVPGSRFGRSTPALVSVPGPRASARSEASALVPWLRDVERFGALPPGESLAACPASPFPLFLPIPPTPSPPGVDGVGFAWKWTAPSPLCGEGAGVTHTPQVFMSRIRTLPLMRSTPTTSTTTTAAKPRRDRQRRPLLWAASAPTAPIGWLQCIKLALCVLCPYR